MCIINQIHQEDIVLNEISQKLLVFSQYLDAGPFSKGLQKVYHLKK
jgi:hypothetical protein